MSPAVSRHARSGPDPSSVRDHLALALDVEDMAAALQLARRLRPWFGVVKVGSELFTAAGPPAVKALTDEGFKVFLDIKLHDIPTTVLRAASRARAIGAVYLTAHTAGGEAMLGAAVEGFGAGGPTGGPAAGGVLGVTVLTSQPGGENLIRERAALAEAAGCHGVVCGAPDLAAVRQSAPGLVPVVPGIRFRDASIDDQVRVATPGEAVTAGAKLLVIGRIVTAAADPEAVAAIVASEVAGALA